MPCRSGAKHNTRKVLKMEDQNNPQAESVNQDATGNAGNALS
jgi:hypothetical protein